MNDGGQDGRPGTAGGGRLVKTKQKTKQNKTKRKTQMQRKKTMFKLENKSK